MVISHQSFSPESHKEVLPMEDLTKIKGVLGCSQFNNDALVPGTTFGKMGEQFSEIEQFWSSAAMVISGNLKLGAVKEVIISGPARQVLLVAKDDNTFLCELEPKADWKAISADIRKKI
jgi:predicted regulator of Ras-like GTPase activity (Roadblock/LC7/MglB family)